LVHCRNSYNQWKICRISWEEADEEYEGAENKELKELIDCPRKTKLVANGQGGVWMWKKAGNRGFRTLSLMEHNGIVAKEKEGERFPIGTITEG
jgi:hypothetical protein